ncbi:MAG: diphthine synthase [Candidatus Micrarchaeota archaeon]|nr:diphthine synthase [Candidatus Micrarchaeota archaeon]
MLYLVGGGLKETDLSLEAVEILKSTECYCETYTSYYPVERVERILGKKIKRLERSDLEEKLPDFLRKAKNADVSLLVPGDPLVATTHINILIEARKMGLPVKVVHGVSVFSAIGEAGLQIYKYGKTASIPFSGHLENVRETVRENKERGLHTLLLLDKQERLMTVSEAVKLLIEANVIQESEKIIAVSVSGRIVYRKARELLKFDFPVPASLVIPGKLHFIEKEFLEMLGG